MTARERPAFPTFPASCWWPLRERFKRALPPAVTAEYLQAVLEVEPKTARNLVPMLRQMGFVDDAGAPRDRANAWRVDAEYRQVCHAIRDELYPSALRHAVPDPTRDFDGAVRWFMKTSGVGTAAAKRMARFYALLSKADPSEPRERGERRSDAPLRRPSPRNGNSPARSEPGTGEPRGGTHVGGSSLDRGVPRAGSRATGGVPGGPPPDSLSGTFPPLGGHSVSPEGITLRPIDASNQAPGSTPVQLVVQIQLPAGATAEQIDQLVASIARHFAPHLSGPKDRGRQS